MLFVKFELNMFCFWCLREAWLYLSKDCSVWQCFSSSHNVTAGAVTEKKCLGNWAAGRAGGI